MACVRGATAADGQLKLHNFIYTRNSELSHYKNDICLAAALKLVRDVRCTHR